MGSQRQKLGISQAFPWFGKLRLREDLASRTAEAAYQRFQAVKLRLFYRLKRAYAEYYYLSRTIAVTKENVALLRYLEQVVRTKYVAATAAHEDLIKAQIELGKLDDRFRGLLELREPLAAKLNAALGRRAGAPVPWPRRLPEERIQAADEELLAWLTETNPELKAMRSNIEGQQSAVELAGKGYYPDVTLGLDYIDTAGARMPGVRDSGKDPVVAMISVNVPIWREKYRAAEREAKARLRSAQESLLDKENTLESEAKLALYGLRDAERKTVLYRDALIPKATQSLKVTETAYRGGKADFLDVLEAQRLLLEFQLSYERALADHVQRLAELEMLVGKEIPRVMPIGADQKGSSD